MSRKIEHKNQQWTLIDISKKSLLAAKNKILVSNKMAQLNYLKSNYHLIELPVGEEGAANSLRINNKKYITFLTKFLKDHDITNVCDIGCGDWQVSKHIDWTGIHYLGIDVVKDVIKKNFILPCMYCTVP